MVLMEQAPEKTEKSLTPSVAIDGARIKNVRETKKLTQLYVANVVGVTTDTISRWENNRYPTIKRENGEKLAGALEVELDEILREEEVAEVEESATTVPASRCTPRMLLAGAALLALLALGVFFIARSMVPAPMAVRWAPRFAAPGQIIPIEIKVTRTGEENIGFILKEKLPPGWRFMSALPANASVDPAGAGVKWLIPGGNASVSVFYTVQLPSAPAAGQRATLTGEVVLHKADLNRTEAVAGNSSIQIGPYHWADRNGDLKIDDDEIMPAYYICEDMKGIGLDWKIIEAIWSGKGYRWDAKNGYTVLK